MKLIVGLGNPDPEHSRNRHNIGFIIVDQLVADHEGQWQTKDRFKADVAEIDGVVYLKPQTYMNASGESLRAMVDFYKIPIEQILVIHDDADIDFGKIRVVRGGNDGGHNGIVSLIQHGLQGIWRLKIGVANEHRAPGQAIDFVLTDFTSEEYERVQAVLGQKNNPIESVVSSFLDDSLEVMSSQL